jgi:hypothetical protein
LRPVSAPSAAINVDKLGRTPLDERAGGIASDNGELRRDWKGGLFSVDTPRTQASSGRLGGRSIALADVTLRMTTPRVSVAVQTLDDEPIARSRDILVSVASAALPSPGSQLPFMSEPTIGDIEIRSNPGLQAAERSGVRVRYEGGRYVVHFDGKTAVHWVSLRRPSKGG